MEDSCSQIEGGREVARLSCRPDWPIPADLPAPLPWRHGLELTPPDLGTFSDIRLVEFIRDLSPVKAASILPSPAQLATTLSTQLENKHPGVGMSSQGIGGIPVCHAPDGTGYKLLELPPELLELLESQDPPPAYVIFSSTPTTPSS